MVSVLSFYYSWFYILLNGFDVKKGMIVMASKPHRGKTLWKLPSHGRGTCPVCKATRIKVLYDMITGDGNKIKVCKRCQNKKIVPVANL